MRSLALALLACLLFSSPVFTQGTPGGPSGVVKSLRWDQPVDEGQSYADVQSYTYTLAIDGMAPAPLTASCNDGAVITCAAPLTLASGRHTLVLTVTGVTVNANGSASASVIVGGPPAAPAHITVMQITVTVGQ